MARNTSRMGLVTMFASSVRTALRPGSAGLTERASAVPRMFGAMSRGEYRGTTFGHVALLAAAVAYIVSPLDFMPEALFSVFGLADDAVVVAWLAAALINDTEAFIAWEHGVGRPSGAASGGRAYAAPQDRGARGPQDMAADDYHRTVRSQVVG